MSGTAVRPRLDWAWYIERRTLDLNRGAFLRSGRAVMNGRMVSHRAFGRSSTFFSSHPINLRGFDGDRKPSDGV